MIEIRHRETGEVLYQFEAATLADADLSGTNLAGADLAGANLLDANLVGADLRHANLREAILGVWLAGVSLENADLRSATLTDALAHEARLARADLRCARLRRAGLCQADLRGANLAGADLRDADFTNALLQGADLRGADLRGARLKDAHLDENSRLDQRWRLVWELMTHGGQGRKLCDADLRGAFLSGADLRGADLRGAHLQGTNLVEADFAGADLRGAEFEGAELSTANWNAATRLDEGWEPVWRLLVTREAEGQDLRGVNLQGARLHEARLRDTTLAGANLNGACLFAADLTGADLRGSSLRGAELKLAQLQHADLREADLSKANFGDAHLGGADLQGTCPEDALPALVHSDEQTRWPEARFQPPKPDLMAEIEYWGCSNQRLVELASVPLTVFTLPEERTPMLAARRELANRIGRRRGQHPLFFTGYFARLQQEQPQGNRKTTAPLVTGVELDEIDRRHPHPEARDRPYIPYAVKQRLGHITLAEAAGLLGTTEGRVRTEVRLGLLLGAPAQDGRDGPVQRVWRWSVQTRRAQKEAAKIRRGIIHEPHDDFEGPEDDLSGAVSFADVEGVRAALARGANPDLFEHATTPRLRAREELLWAIDETNPEAQERVPVLSQIVQLLEAASTDFLEWD